MLKLFTATLILFSSVAMANTEKISVSIQGLLDSNPSKSKQLLKIGKNLKNVRFHWDSFKTNGVVFEVCSQTMGNIVIPVGFAYFYDGFQSSEKCSDIKLLAPKGIVNPDFENLARPSYEIREASKEIRTQKRNKTIIYYAQFYQLIDLQTDKIVGESEYHKYRMAVCKAGGCQQQQMQHSPFGTSKTKDIMSLINLLEL